MSGRLQRYSIGLAVFLYCFSMAAASIRAEELSDSGSWEFAGEAFLWVAGIEGTSVAGDEIDISFSDLLGQLEGGIMGLLSARKGKWGLYADINYMSIHEETSSTANIIGIPAKLDVDVEMKGFITTLGVAYRIYESERASLDMLAGGRYFKLDVDFEAESGSENIKYSDSGDVLDGIIGARAIIDLSESWYLLCAADVGAGDSKLTWQTRVGVGYRLEKVDMFAGYRHLEWELEDGDTVEDLSFSGPLLGVRFRF